MKYTTLNNGPEISKVSLGTMLWGGTVSQKDAFDQISLANDLGINLWDTAEVYTVPANKDTYGSTEVVIGNYFKENPSKKDDVLIATKMATGQFSNWIREGLGKTPSNIIDAVNGSLERMHLNSLGIFQIHYPTRSVNPDKITSDDIKADEDVMVNIIKTCNDLIKEGKIQAYGLCNETAWGITKFCAISRELNLIKPLTVQNEYNLLTRKIDTDIAEASIREHTPVLAFSPLAGGLLTGKHLLKTQKDSRYDNWSKHKKNNYISEKGSGNFLIKDYVELANSLNITPAELALSWVMHRSFMGSTIVAGTKLEHLKNNINAVNIELTDETLLEIEAIHNRYK